MTVKAEERLLLACAANPGQGKARERIREAARSVGDWGNFAEAAKRHGLLPLAASRLAGLEKEALPPAAAALLRRKQAESARAGAFLFQEATRLIRLLESRSITAVPFKGPVMADEIYGDLSFRPPGDLDFLLTREDAARARDILLAEGFRPHFTLSPRRQRAYERYYYAYTLFREKNRLVVDLHWGLGRRFFPPILDRLQWRERLRRIPLGGGEVTVLSLEDLLLLLCLHGAKHRWERLVWLVDVARLVKGGEGTIDWDLVAGEAERTGAATVLLTALALAGEILGAPLPAPITGRIGQSAKVRLLVGELRDGLPGGSTPPALRKARFQFHSLDRRGDRIRFLALWALLPNLNDWWWISLPDVLYPLYYILRPLRLLASAWGIHRGRGER